MAVIGQKMKDIWVRIKDFFGKMSKKARILLCVGAVGILLFAVVLTAFLNTRATAYQVMFPGMSTEEASSVYQSLIRMGAQTKINENNEVMVLSSEYDIWLLALVAEGYPNSATAMPYDIYGQYSGITATETDRKRGDLFQLQDRIQGTLKQMGGVMSSVVTISVPESSDYVWQIAENQERPTASVLLTLKTDTTFTPEQVTTVKNLLAKSVQNLLPEDVAVVDAKSSLELMGVAAEDEKGLTSNQTVELEKMVQKQIEDNIVKLLTRRYGSNGVVASAKVTLDFNKMMTEQLELQEKPVDENGDGGGGFVTSSSGHYGSNGQETFGGIVGEEDNTDEPPQYGYVKPGNGNDASYYDWKTELEYSYVKTQVEKGNAPIERATVSVLVDETSMTQARRDELTNLISTSVDIPVELISVSPFQPNAIIDSGEEDPPAPPTPDFWADIPLWVYFAAAGVLVLLVTLIVVLIVRSRKKKRRLASAKLAEEEAVKLMAEEEIEDYKKQLSAAAKSTNSAKDDAILGEVRDFAKENPEITAGLLRSWLRESE